MLAKCFYSFCFSTAIISIRVYMADRRRGTVIFFPLTWRSFIVINTSSQSTVFAKVARILSTFSKDCETLSRDEISIRLRILTLNVIRDWYSLKFATSNREFLSMFGVRYVYPLRTCVCRQEHGEFSWNAS